MSLLRFHPRDYFYSSPMERFLVNALENTFDDRAYRSLHSVAPYWLNQSLMNECNIGNAIGEVKNEKDKFSVQIDVSHFHPKELSVSVRGRELVIEGHHNERSDQPGGGGSIERHFTRKYLLPEEAQPETVESHLSDAGILTVCANKAAIGAPAARSIPIRASPKEPQGSVEHATNQSQ
ncbi:unnamed protein product [Thelazia callipaeda]|uniref:SHSP domain-containing protein n=1 Tax=Thelazia callipaeda TaxID=103827 RepID=A0A0N5CQF2_THECL|nr:unnamed protein product [Thelazia callipaeda]